MTENRIVSRIVVFVPPPGEMMQSVSFVICCIPIVKYKTGCLWPTYFPSPISISIYAPLSSPVRFSYKSLNVSLLHFCYVLPPGKRPPLLWQYCECYSAFNALQQPSVTYKTFGINWKHKQGMKRSHNPNWEDPGHTTGESSRFVKFSGRKRCDVSYLCNLLSGLFIIVPLSLI